MFILGLLAGGVIVFFFKPQIENMIVKVIQFVRKKDTPED